MKFFSALVSATFFGIVLPSAATACNATEDVTDTDIQEASGLPGLGRACGGNGRPYRCKAGLVCQVDPEMPGSAGVCVKATGEEDTPCGGPDRVKCNAGLECDANPETPYIPGYCVRKVSHGLGDPCA